MAIELKKDGWAENERETTAEFLRLVSESQETAKLIQAATMFFQRRSGCEAVGIRLRNGGDYPYFEAHGFPKEFIRLENSLCARDDAGRPITGKDGYPVQECMCGNVISGRFDPSKPFFTPQGSFWTNCTTDLLATSTDADRQVRTRNRCNGEGYESVALIPLHNGAERIGLLQLNDHQKGMFSPESIELWQRMADYLAVAVAKLQAEEASLYRLQRLELLTQTAGELLQSTDPQSVVESLCAKVMEHLDCQAFFNFLVDDRAGKLRLNACAGIPKEEAAKIEWLDYGTAVCGCAARDGCRIVAEHIPSTPDPRTELVKSYGIKAYACHPLLGPAGEVIGTLSFGTRTRETYSAEDLSLMKAVADQVAVAMIRIKGEQVLRRTADDLRRSVKELEQFAYVASHDLQEPLRLVEGFLTRLVDRCGNTLDDRGRQYVDFAVQGARRMSQLVYSLSEYSRVQAYILKPVPINMKEVLDQVLAECGSYILAAGASVTWDALPIVMGDATQITLLLKNLIGNAIKFRRDGIPPKVHVRAFLKGQEWIVSVQDNGIGIAGNQSERVFLIFQRLHTQDKFPGIGVGLAICKKIVERHGGRIWFESKEGSGSKFLFTIPAE